MMDTWHSLAPNIIPVLASLNLYLYDIELSSAGKGNRTLRVLVDRVDGVDLEAITAATREISAVLDEPATAGADLLAGQYTLEVSSPGLERPLRRIEHWQGARGRVATVKFRRDGVASRSRGVIISATNDVVVLEVDGTEESIPFAEITGARTVFEWGTDEARMATKKPKSSSKSKSKSSSKFKSKSKSKSKSRPRLKSAKVA